MNNYERQKQTLYSECKNITYFSYLLELVRGKRVDVQSERN